MHPYMQLVNAPWRQWLAELTSFITVRYRNGNRRSIRNAFGQQRSSAVMMLLKQQHQEHAL
jgi:hypothetical protein